MSGRHLARDGPTAIVSTGTERGMLSGKTADGGPKVTFKPELTAQKADFDKLAIIERQPIVEAL